MESQTMAGSNLSFAKYKLSNSRPISSSLWPSMFSSVKWVYKTGHELSMEFIWDVPGVLTPPVNPNACFLRSLRASAQMSPPHWTLPLDTLLFFFIVLIITNKCIIFIFLSSVVWCTHWIVGIMRVRIAICFPSIWNNAWLVAKGMKCRKSLTFKKYGFLPSLFYLSGNLQVHI